MVASPFVLVLWLFLVVLDVKTGSFTESVAVPQRMAVVAVAVIVVRLFKVIVVRKSVKWLARVCEGRRFTRKSDFEK